jgi:Rhodopirellula transposase DDE domain
VVERSSAGVARVRRLACDSERVPEMPAGPHFLVCAIWTQGPKRIAHSREGTVEHIAARVQDFQKRGEPVIPVEAKKKRVDGFQHARREWHLQGQGPQVRVYESIDPEWGKALSYRVYGLHANVGWVSVGVDYDMPAFSVYTKTTLDLKLLALMLLAPHLRLLLRFNAWYHPGVAEGDSHMPFIPCASAKRYYAGKSGGISVRPPDGWLPGRR